MVLANGYKYEGDYRDGKEHGRGHMVRAKNKPSSEARSARLDIDPPR